MAARERDEHIADALSRQIRRDPDRARNGHKEARETIGMNEGQVRNVS